MAKRKRTVVQSPQEAALDKIAATSAPAELRTLMDNMDQTLRGALSMAFAARMACMLNEQ